MVSYWTISISMELNPPPWSDPLPLRSNQASVWFPTHHDDNIMVLSAPMHPWSLCASRRNLWILAMPVWHAFYFKTLSSWLQIFVPQDVEDLERNLYCFMELFLTSGSLPWQLSALIMTSLQTPGSLRVACRAWSVRTLPMCIYCVVWNPSSCSWNTPLYSTTREIIYDYGKLLSWDHTGSDF